VSDDRHVAPQSNNQWACERVHDELEGWSLGSLDTSTSDEVEQHLAVCEQCRHDAAALARVASMLPFSLAPVSPSGEAKRALMARIADEQMAVAEAQSHVSLPRIAGPPMPTPPQEPRRRVHWSQMLVTPLALALVVMTLWSIELRDQVSDSGGGDSRSATVSMLPEGFQTFTMQSDCEKCRSTSKLLADPAQASALMVAWDLDPGEVHQIWCEEGDGSQVLVASLDVSSTGEVVQPLVFDQPIDGYSRIYMVSRNGETSEIRLGAPGISSPSPIPTQKQ
jgi:uncharacterized CHY-type Zn-finger protein